MRTKTGSRRAWSWWPAITGVIWCVVGSSSSGRGVPWARRTESETPRCGGTPHSGPGAHMPLWCAAADREPGWLCAHYSSRGEREGEWEGSSRLAPQACRLPRPQHCTNESRGSGWAHTGGQGLLPRAKRSQRKETWGEEARRHQQGLLQQTCTPAVIVQACVQSDIVVLSWWWTCMDWNISQELPVGARISDTIYARSHA